MTAPKGAETLGSAQGRLQPSFVSDVGISAGSSSRVSFLQIMGLFHVFVKLLTFLFLPPSVENFCILS